MRRHVLAIVLLLGLSWWSIRPLFLPGFFPVHDDTQVGRVVAMGRAMRNGQFPVRWVAELGYGYGYPIFNFYAPLPYYVGGLLYALGLSGLVATKIMFGLGIILAPLTLYAVTVGFFGRLGAVVSSLLYLYAPYHAVQVYVRGAAGEFWTLVFLPLIFWGLWSRTKLIGGLGLAGVILSHTLLGYVTALFLIVGLIIKRYHARLLLIGLGLSAFFWLPALFEMGFTSVTAQVSPSANYLDHFVCPAQLWDSPWGFGGSAPGCVDGLSFKLGKLHIVLAALAIGWSILRRRFTTRSPIVTSLAITVGSIFFLLPLSDPFWKLLPGFSYLQYPWRFLAFASMGLSVVGASLVAMTRSAFVRTLLALLVTGGTLVLYPKLFVPQYSYAKQASAFENAEELRWRVSKISDEYLPPAIPRPATQEEIPGRALAATGSLEVETEIEEEVYMKFQLLSKTDQSIRIDRAYFPGWHYWVNGHEVVPILSAGLGTVTIPQGHSVVEMRFTNTPIRTAGNAVSLVTALALLYVYGKKTYA